MRRNVWAVVWLTKELRHGLWLLRYLPRAFNRSAGPPPLCAAAVVAAANVNVVARSLPARRAVYASQSMRSTILVLEDDELMRELLRMHLTNAGYEVLVAEDAVVAGRLLMTQRPDLIVTDIEMPFMDGLELVELLRADAVAANIPVIFVSSRSDFEDRCMELGAVAFLQKPVLADRLLALVGEHVPGGRMPL